MTTQKKAVINPSKPLSTTDLCDGIPPLARPAFLNLIAEDVTSGAITALPFDEDGTRHFLIAPDPAGQRQARTHRETLIKLLKPGAGTNPLSGRVAKLVAQNPDLYQAIIHARRTPAPHRAAAGPAPRRAAPPAPPAADGSPPAPSRPAPAAGDASGGPHER